MEKSFLKSYKDKYMTLINKISDSENDIDIRHYEASLFMLVMAPIFAGVAFLNIFLTVVWEIDIAKGIVFFGVFYASSWIFKIYAEKKIKINIKTRIYSSLIVLGILTTYYVYYERLAILFYFILVVLTLLGMLNTSRTFLIYSYITYPVIFIVAQLQYPMSYLQIDGTFNLVLIILFAIIMVVSLLINSLYRSIFHRKIGMFSDMMSQNEEITALYEEIVASEETLKEQNEKLNVYNKKITQNQKQLKFLAYSDTLTGLPNRKMIMQQLEVLMDLNEENQHPFSIVFIDLDNFKKINDSMGHIAGDELLVQVTQRLKGHLNPKDLLGRLGGDEIALIIRRNITDEAILAYVEGICQLFEESFNIQNKYVRMSASFGIAIWPYDGASISDLLKAADTAMYKAKENGKNNVQYYRKEMKNEVLKKIELENRLLSAMKNDEFFLEYQPLFDAKTKGLLGFEALIRWLSPDLGRVSPADFIPIAEEVGFINEVGDWVIQTACQKINELNMKYDPSLTMSINVSTVQMKNPDFVNRVISIMKNTKVDPTKIQFEITESVFVHNINHAIEMMNELKSYGIRIALDDFGTGYSSLSYLMELPIDTLKIDKSFVDAINQEEKKSIVGSIISMVHNLDMSVVAEGVETDNQLVFLANENCDIIQGYLLGKPMNDEQLLTLFAANADTA